MSIQIIRAKPNPIGKDRFGVLSPAVQLAGEWIDVANTGITSVSLNDLVLYHKSYNDFCVELGTAIVTGFQGVLNSGEAVRIHSGWPLPLEQMYREDALGADYHIFTNKNYVWNNNCGDSPRLYNSLTRSWIDIAYYDPNPVEGSILKRIGNKLM